MEEVESLEGHIPPSFLYLLRLSYGAIVEKPVSQPRVTVRPSGLDPTDVLCSELRHTRTRMAHMAARGGRAIGYEINLNVTATLS